jgi:signal peptidase II
MAFGIFNEGATDFSRWALIGVSVLVLGALVWFIGKAWRGGQLVPLPFFLVLSGALGNLYDRIVYASVTDFIDLHIGDHHWPTFNIADSAITVGALWLLLLSWREGRASKAAEA